MKALVYVAGPYTKPDPVTNTRRAIEAGLEVHDRSGAGVIIPHLSLFAHLVSPRHIDYWYAFDLKQVEHCTHLLRLPGESTGADAEVRYADDLLIPIFTDLDALVYDIVRGNS